MGTSEQCLKPPFHYWLVQRDSQNGLIDYSQHKGHRTTNYSSTNGLQIRLLVDHFISPSHKSNLVGGFNPSEKYQSLGMIIPNICENKKCSKPPTSNKWHDMVLFRSILLWNIRTVVFHLSSWNKITNTNLRFQHDILSVIRQFSSPKMESFSKS